MISNPANSSRAPANHTNRSFLKKSVASAAIPEARSTIMPVTMTTHSPITRANTRVRACDSGVAGTKSSLPILPCHYLLFPLDRLRQHRCHVVGHAICAWKGAISYPTQNGAECAKLPTDRVLYRAVFPRIKPTMMSCVLVHPESGVFSSSVCMSLPDGEPIIHSKSISFFPSRLELMQSLLIQHIQ